MACGDVLSLEDLQTAKKHQIFEAEVITGKVGGVAGGATIDTATNPVTGQTQQTLPSILADLGFDVQSWTSSTGGVLASANQVFLNNTTGSLGLGDYYAWGGTFPKTVPAGTDPAPVGSGYIMRSSRFAGTQAREALRRSYAEAGYNLVDGSFEAGGTLVNTNDALLHEATGKAFSGPAGAVAAGTNPASGGFVDKSGGLLRHELATSNGATKVGTSDGGSVQDLADNLKNIVRTQVDTNPTLTFNSNYNISNPESIASWNSGGKAILPNFIGHNVEIKRFTGTLPTVFDVPVSFNVTPQQYRNVVFTAQRNGFLKVFLAAERTVTGYGTPTISIEPLASEMVGVTEVDVWVIGDPDQHITGDTEQQNLQHNIGGYDLITNRQQSYNMGAHNVIAGTGDHQCIYGATYSIIDARGSYNLIDGGTNNQITGTATGSRASGEGIRVQGSYTYLGGFNSRDKSGCAHNFGWGRDLSLGANAAYNAMFGKGSSTSSSATHNLVTGESCTALESYAAIGGKGSQARSYSVAHGENMLVSASHSYGFGFNGLSTKKYSGMSGYQPVVRNTGSIVHGASKGAQGDDQFFSVQLKNSVASGVSTWTKLLTLDDVNKVVLDGSSLASITARIGVKSNDGASFADIEVKAFYTNSGSHGVIGSTTTVLHSVGGNAGTISARIIEATPGSFSFSVEVTTGNASFGAIASAKVDVMEFV